MEARRSFFSTIEGASAASDVPPQTPIPPRALPSPTTPSLSTSTTSKQQPESSLLPLTSQHHHQDPHHHHHHHQQGLHHFQQDLHHLQHLLFNRHQSSFQSKPLFYH
ncbi:hypothetical protein RRG08_024004 [Elysia crispata]|uniref:Uncharacterized protein n=1 Tax=Elysia crispata TaxID=231223 RepID=A0AAE0YMD3_9GAST|nr:hypothetical protein RRG08_024004 [Elysia crispata]